MYPDGLPDFIKTGWVKYYGGVPWYFYAWHNTTGYHQALLWQAPPNQAHNFRVNRIGVWGGNNPYTYSMFIDDYAYYTEGIRSPYTAPFTNFEHNSTADPNTGADFWGIRELTSQFVWWNPVTLRGDDDDPSHGFSWIDNTYWKTNNN